MPPKDKASADLPSGMSKIQANIPSYPLWQIDKPRETWETEYDRIENELMKSVLPGSASICRRRPVMPLVIPIVTSNSNPSQRTNPPPIAHQRPPSARNPPRAKSPPRAASAKPSETSTNPAAKNRNLRPLSAAPVQAMPSPAPPQPSPSPALRRTAAPSPVGKPKPTPISLADLGALYSIVNPTLDFKGAIHVDTRHMDLSWVQDQKKLAQMSAGNAVSLETMRDDLLTNLSIVGTNLIALGSPRSILILLCNGVSVLDLQIKDITHFQGLGIDRDIAAMRLEHHENRRKALLSQLKVEYRELRATMGWSEMASFIKHCNANSAAMNNSAGMLSDSGSPTEMGDTSTFILQRKQKQNAVIENTRKRLMKQVEYHDELMRLQQVAAEKRAVIEAEHREERERKKKEAVERKKIVDERMEVLRRENQERSKQFTQQVEAKARELQEKEEKRRVMEAEKQAMHKRLQEESREEFALRMTDNAERYKQLMVQKRQAFEEKERVAAERKRNMELEASKELRAKAERKRRVEELRSAALQKARDKQDEVRQQGLRTQSAVEQRLADFAAHREEERRVAAKEELEKREHQQLVRQSAVEKLEQKQRQAQEKQMKVEECVKEQRAIAAMESRLSLERDRLASDDKHFFLHRQQMAKEFRKAKVVDHLRRKADHVETQNKLRGEILRQTLESRLEVSRERDALRAKIEERKH